MLSLKEKVKEQLVLSQDIKAIRAIDKLLNYAIGLEAAEISFEPGENDLTVIFRADGETKNKLVVPKKLEHVLLAGLKEMAGATVTEKNISWGGKFKKDYPGFKIIFSLAVRPTAAGEKITIDLKKEKFELLEMNRLGFNRRALSVIHNNLDKRKGLALVIGDFNSGRTTTLYSFLNYLNKPELNLATIEKDVAYDIPRVNQSRLDPISGFDAPSAARSLRRQDADVVMFGEINDKETAEAAFNLALAGHFVMSGLYGSDLRSALAFLQDLPVPLQLFGSAVKMVVTQRLLKKTCPFCLAEQKLGPGAWKKLRENFALGALLKRWRADRVVFKKIASPEDLVFYKSRGCARCGQSGYLGRIGVFEVLENTPSLKQKIKEGHLSGLSEEVKKQGAYLLQEDALLKAVSGLTTVEEVIKMI